MTLSIREITRRLNAGLGPTLVAGLAGAKDARISREWSKHDGPYRVPPRPSNSPLPMSSGGEWSRSRVSRSPGSGSPEAILGSATMLR